MLKWVFIAVLCYVGYQIAERFMIHPERYRWGFKSTVPTGSPVASKDHEKHTESRPAEREHVPAATPRPLYGLVVEEYRGGDGRTFLHTSGGEYLLGQMSSKGLVEGMSGHVARVRGMYGELLFVCGDRMRPVVERVVPDSTPAPVYKAGEMSAKWVPVESEFSQRESARFKAELEKPIGESNRNHASR